MRNLGYLATIAAGSLVGLASEGYAQDSPTDDKTGQVDGQLEARLVDVDAKLRYDVFDRVYDEKVIAEYEKVSDEALGEEYGDDYLKSLSKSGKMRGFAISFGEALEDAFDNPDKVLGAMDKSDRELYDKFDATEALEKQKEDPIFRDMIGVTSEYKFSPDRESDKLAAFVADYVKDDLDSYIKTNFGVAKVVLAVGDGGKSLKDIETPNVKFGTPRYDRASNLFRSIFKK